jgi:POT family proton-dependent oligopeptide transporter
MRRTLSHIGSPTDEKPVNRVHLAAVLAGALCVIFATMLVLQSLLVARICVYLAGVAVLGIFLHLIRSSHRDERAGLIAALILVLQIIFFFIFYQQMSTSLNLFAQHNVNLDFRLFGWHLFNWIPEQYQNLNAIWIVVLSPVLVLLYNWLGRRGRDLAIAAKFAWGFAAVAAGFFIYGIGANSAVNGQVSSWIMVWGYGLYSLGELLVSGLGLAMIARYVPERMGGFMMGAYFVAVGLSQYLGSVVANIAHIPENLHDPLESLAIYTSLFNKLGFAGILCTLIAIAMLPLMKKLSRSHAAGAAKR